jgi:nicotinate phosphoribosyltransferase
MDAFLTDFDLYFAKLFDGLRHDSGDPAVWAEKALAHYARLRIDAHTKRLVFSDGLDLPAALRLYAAFADRAQLGFGIGTNLTNDVGHAPINIVMKLTGANGQPVAKLSDAPGKTLCDDQTFLAYLRQVFNAPAF